MDFLDLVISVDQCGYIQTDLHTKANAKNSYLLPTSNPPSHICHNIPYILSFRIKCNCSKAEMFDQKFAELRVKSVERGYRGRLVDTAISKVKELEREDILNRVFKVDKKIRIE